MDTDEACNSCCPAHCRSTFHATTATVHGRWKAFLPLLSIEDTRQQVVIPDPGSLISDTQAEIERNLSTIQALKQQVAQLKAATQELRGNLRVFRLQRSSLHTFPSETLIEIFHSSSHEGSTLGDVVNSPPLTLSQACSRWRSIVRSTPSLWTTINWTIQHQHNFAKQQRRLQLLDMVLELSIPQPLTIDLKLWATTSGFAESALQAFCKHSERWLHVSLDCSGDTSIDRFACRFPILETLYVDIASRQRLDFERAPRLHRVSLGGGYQCSLPWHQLQNLELGFWTYDMLASNAVLNKATSLIVLTVRAFDEELQPHERVLCPTIQGLRLVGKGDWGTAYFLDLINVPNLQALKLVGYGYRIRSFPFPMQKFTNLVTHSGFSLKSLSLSDILLNEPDILPLFTLLSSLEELYLEEYAPLGELYLPSTILTDSLFNAFKGTSSSDGLLPNLRHLTIKSNMPMPISSSFVDALICRSQTGLPRLTVSVPWYRLSAFDVVRVRLHGLDFWYNE